MHHRPPLWRLRGHAVRFLDDRSGATAIEYGLIAGLISVIIISALTSVGSKINSKFTTISSKLN